MRNFIRICLILGISASLASCAPEKPLKVSVFNVSLDKKSFNPSEGEKVKISYKLSKKAFVAMRFYNSDNNLVTTLVPKGIDKRGYNVKIWDGRDNSGEILPAEAYTYTIEAKDASGRETYLHDLADETGGIELTLRELTFDCKTGIINYVLPKAARIRARVGMKEGGPLLATLVDWELKEAGRGAINWDGMDSSGVLSFLGNPNVFVNIAAFSLPENSIILKGEKKFAFQKKELEKRPMKEVNIKKHMHALHKRAKCHEPSFTLEILEIKDDILPVRLELDEQDKVNLINSRFEILFFLDNVFLFEEEEGTSPFTYRLDIRGLNKGEHVLTVNIQSYEDHIAAASKKIFIGR